MVKITKYNNVDWLFEISHSLKLVTYEPRNPGIQGIQVPNPWQSWKSWCWLAQSDKCFFLKKTHRSLSERNVKMSNKIIPRLFKSNGLVEAISSKICKVICGNNHKFKSSRGMWNCMADKLQSKIFKWLQSNKRNWIIYWKTRFQVAARLFSSSQVLTHKVIKTLGKFDNIFKNEICGTL